MCTVLLPPCQTTQLQLTNISHITFLNNSSILTRAVQLISILPQHRTSKLPSVQGSAPYTAILQMKLFTSWFLKFKSKLLVKRVFLVERCFGVIAILDLISRAHFASFVIKLPKSIKYSTFPSCFWSITMCVGDGCPEILTALVFFFKHWFLFQSIFQFQLVYQSPFLQKHVHWQKLSRK